ncbi:MAG: serine hydrolase [Salibacteraceae bacterium]
MRVFYGVFLLLLSLHSYAQRDTATLKSFIDEAATTFGLPALEVAIVDQGQVLFTHGVGERSVEVPKAPDGKTMFAIASLSKAFTTACLAILVEEGKLKWEDPVVKHLPWFKLHDDYVTQNITVEDLLCHRSGLITFDGDLLWYGSTYDREEIVKRIRERPLTHGFREKFGYQNIMFITAGEVIEAVSGHSFDDFVRDRLLRPLNMTRTTTRFDEFSLDRNMAKPHLDGEQIFSMSYENSGATAAINSCARDLARWSNFWLAGGVIDNDTLLSESSINRIWTIHTTLPTGSFDEDHQTKFKGYGMGWFVMDYHGKKVVHHGGGLPGYISKVALLPEDDFGIVVLTNDMSSVPTMMMYAAVDWYHGRDYTHWLDTFLELKESSEERSKLEKEARLEEKKDSPLIYPPGDYVGMYEDAMYGPAEILVEGGEMILRLIPSKELFSGRLSPWMDHAFRFDHNDPFLTYGVIEFDIEKDLIKGFTIDLPNQDFHFDKLYFERK